MSDDWFSDPDSTGTVTVAWREDGWYVADSETDKDVKCLLPDEVSLRRSKSPHQIEVRVTKFMRAVDRGPSYLFLDRTDDARATEVRPQIRQMERHLRNRS